MIDAHVHVWGPTIAPLAWLDATDLPRSVDIDDVSVAGTPVVLVTADTSASDQLTEARAFSGLAASGSTDLAGRIHGFVAGIDVTGDVANQLDALLSLPGLVGVRHNLQDVLAGLDADALVGGLQTLGERGIPFDACVRAHELPLLTRLLDQVPDLLVVVDHMGKPPVADAAALGQWRHDLAALACRPNTLCKLSGLPAECHGPAGLDHVAPQALDTTLELFGSDRCMVGSDAPISHDPHWIDRVLARVPDGDRELVATQVAERTYRRLI